MRPAFRNSYASAFFIDLFQETRAQGMLHFQRAPDDAFGERVQSVFICVICVICGSNPC
jgi:hypothetical protein